MLTVSEEEEGGTDDDLLCLVEQLAAGGDTVSRDNLREFTILVVCQAGSRIYLCYD